MKPTPVLTRIASFVFCLALLHLGNGATASASKITDDLKLTIDEVLRVVTNKDNQADKKNRREQIRKLIDPRFSYEQMSMRSMAQAWKELSPDEQREFVQLFTKLLENSYASKIESAKDEQVRYTSEQVKGDYSLVKTEIVRKDGVIDVDYKLINLNGEWKVYDLVIEGVSLVNNYRSQFGKIFTKEAYKGLREKMLSKINSIEANRSAGDDL